MVSPLVCRAGGGGSDTAAPCRASHLCYSLNCGLRAAQGPQAARGSKCGKRHKSLINVLWVRSMCNMNGERESGGLTIELVETGLNALATGFAIYYMA